MTASAGRSTGQSHRLGAHEVTAERLHAALAARTVVTADAVAEARGLRALSSLEEGDNVAFVVVPSTRALSRTGLSFAQARAERGRLVDLAVGRASLLVIDADNAIPRTPRWALSIAAEPHLVYVMDTAASDTPAINAGVIWKHDRSKWLKVELSMDAARRSTVVPTSVSVETLPLVTAGREPTSFERIAMVDIARRAVREHLENM